MEIICFLTLFHVYIHCTECALGATICYHTQDDVHQIKFVEDDNEDRLSIIRDACIAIDDTTDDEKHQ